MNMTDTTMPPVDSPEILASAPTDLANKASSADMTEIQSPKATELYRAALPRVIVMLPAFNEEEAIGPLLDRIGLALTESNLDYHIIVVDDGSSDETARIVSQATFRLPLTLVEHSQNRGLAAALRTGFEAAVSRARENDIIFTMDADNTHPPGLMLRMLDQIREGCDVVVASRFQPGSQVMGVPFDRVLLSIAARWMFKTAFPIQGIRDYTCGFRAYRANVLQSAMQDYGESFVSETGFSCMVDVLLKLRRRGLVMGEAPMILRYDQKGGASKMQVLRTIRQTLSLMLRRRLGGTRPD